MEDHKKDFPRYRGSTMTRTTYVVNNIFRFCFQIGGESSRSADDGNKKGVEI
jgi:hypothetical protein